jgi:hypothetical protein
MVWRSMRSTPLRTPSRKLMRGCAASAAMRAPSAEVSLSTGLNLSASCSLEGSGRARTCSPRRHHRASRSPKMVHPSRPDELHPGVLDCRPGLRRFEDLVVPAGWRSAHRFAASARARRAARKKVCDGSARVRRGSLASKELPDLSFAEVRVLHDRAPLRCAGMRDPRCYSLGTESVAFRADRRGLTADALPRGGFSSSTPSISLSN